MPRFSTPTAVGFRNSELADTSEGGGFKMISPSFASIGKKGCYLSQLIPMGYEYNEDMLYVGYGTDGQFNIQMLSNKGKVLGSYGWTRTNYTMEPDGWNDDGHWTTPDSKEVVPGTDTDVLFPAGTGLYFNCPGNEGDEGTQYPLQMAGQVDLSSVPVTFLKDGGFQCLGNPYPTSIWLSSIIPQGYEYNEDMLYVGYGTDGQFNIQMLSAKGKVLGSYGWTRSNYTMEPDGWNDDGHWTTPDSKEIKYNPQTGKYDNDLEIKPGMGVYFYSPGHEGDDPEEHPYTTVINYPESK